MTIGYQFVLVEGGALVRESSLPAFDERNHAADARHVVGGQGDDAWSLLLAGVGEADVFLDGTPQ